MKPSKVDHTREPAASSILRLEKIKSIIETAWEGKEILRG
jgi:hypothetical protein